MIMKKNVLIILTILLFAENYAFDFGSVPSYKVELNSYNGSQLNYKFKTKKNKYQENIDLNFNLIQDYFQINFKYKPRYKENIVYLDSLYLHHKFNEITVGFISGKIGYVEKHSITKDMIHDEFYQKYIFGNYQFNGLSFDNRKINFKIGGNVFNTGLIALDYRLFKNIKLFSLFTGRDANFNGKMYSIGYSGFYKINKYSFNTNFEYESSYPQNKNVSRISDIYQYHEISAFYKFLHFYVSYFEQKNLKTDILKLNQNSFRGRIDFIINKKFSSLIYYLRTNYPDFNETRYTLNLKYGFFEKTFIAPEVVFVKPSIGRNYYTIGIQSKWQIKF